MMTNGEKILNTFPNATTRICKNNGFTYIEVEQNDKWIADYDVEWWNSEYKESTTENKVVSKIRAEIEKLEEGISSYHNDRPWLFKDEVLQIVDKCKTESEDKK